MAAAPNPKLGPVSVVRTASRHYHAFRRRLAVLVVLSTVAAVLEAAIVIGIAGLASMLVSGEKVLSHDFIGVTVELDRSQALAALAVIVVARAALDYAFIRLKASTASLYEATKRIELLEAFLASEWSHQSGEQVGAFQNAVSQVLNQCRIALLTTIQWSQAGISLVVMLAASVVAGGLASIVLLASLVVLAVIFRPLLRRSHEAAGHLRQSSNDYAVQLNETVSMAREIFVFDSADAVMDETRSITARVRRALVQYDVSSGLLGSMYTNAIYLGAVVGLGVLLAADVDSAAPYAAMVLLIFRGLGYGRTFQSNYQALVSAMPYLADLDVRLDGYRAAGRPVGTEAVERPFRSVELRSVEFAYEPGHPVLHGIDLTIEAGDAVGIVGPSGAGKSTILALLLRMRRATSGAVLLDGRPVGDYEPRGWADLVSLVPQEALLFDRSVRDNIACFRPGITDEEVRDAARQARILDEVEQLPDGFDTVVGERGSRLSGGQRQRLCLARALAGRPELLILDEPTSGLDLASEEAVRVTLEGLKSQVTLVIVAHRLSTLRICDRVVVVNHGTIEAIGARQELEEGNAYYAEAVRLAKLV